MKTSDVCATDAPPSWAMSSEESKILFGTAKAYGANGAVLCATDAPPSWAMSSEESKILFGTAKAYGADGAVLSFFESTKAFVDVKRGARPSIPGDATAVFCVAFVESVKSGSSEVFRDAVVPSGTGFAISKKYLFTSLHNCVDDAGDGLTLVLVPEMVSNEPLLKSAIIPLNFVHSNDKDDWAVFERADGKEFLSTAKICPESRLPSAADREAIGIKDYPIGLVSSNSSSRLVVQSVQVKVSQYETRCEENKTSRKKPPSKFSVPLVDDADPAACPAVPAPVRDVIMVNGGRVRGSCGAPYFNIAGEVVAFHIESLDDYDENATGSLHSASHVSYSHGYVLCRLLSFVQWYETFVGQIA